MNNCITSLYEQIKTAIPEDQIDNHYSDLYVLISPESTALIQKYEFKSNVKTFRSNAGPHKGKMWFDIPFAFQPYWDKRQKV